VTSSAPTAPVERCADCLRPRSECEHCVGGSESRHDAYRKSQCQAVTIARLRSENATLRERNQLDRDLIDATLRWREYDETHDPKSPGWTSAPIVGFFMAVARYRAASSAQVGPASAQWSMFQERLRLEAAVVEAAIVWNQGVPLADDDEPLFTQNDELGKAVDALLAHRAQKGADDGQR
jgi:hypothetical protein